MVLITTNVVTFKIIRIVVTDRPMQSFEHSGLKQCTRLSHKSRDLSNNKSLVKAKRMNFGCDIQITEAPLMA